MNYKKLTFILWISFAAATETYAQELVMYKQADTTQLMMEVYRPATDDQEGLPALVFFFGGGWIGGSRQQFLPHARYYAEKGVVCFLVDYRVSSRHKTSPFDALKDAKSAIRYIRRHATDWGVDPDKIIASGGSAGGHLAAATALIDEYNDPKDDKTISCIPNALVLFNPVIDNGPGGYGYDRIGEAYKAFSPLHNLDKDTPPTILFLGTADKLIPVETAQYYQKVMQKTGARCELRLYDGAGHGFFNFKNREYFEQTISETDEFLQSLGYLTKAVKNR